MRMLLAESLEAIETHTTGSTSSNRAKKMRQLRKVLALPKMLGRKSRSRRS